MLKYLEVSEFALIEHLEIELQGGLNLLTGETGSGKSIIVDALGLLLGDKGYAEMIRTGAEKAAVLGLFELDDERLRRKIQDCGLGLNSEELIIKRELASSGKSRAFINNQLTPVSLLKEIGRYLVDIYGQSGEQVLCQEEAQLQLLDAFAGTGDLVGEVRELYSRYQEKSQQLAGLRRSEQQRLRHMDLLAFQIGEIEKARLKAEDEEEQLLVEQGLLANADRLFQLASLAYTELYEAESSASTAVKHACRLLEELGRVDRRCLGFLEQMQSVRINVDDVALSLREYSSNIEVNPPRLEWVQNRIADIDRLKRKYGNSVREILEYCTNSKTELETLQKADENVANLESERSTLRELYAVKASELSEKRKVAAQSLEKSVEKELAQLAMAKTCFRVAFWEDRPRQEIEGEGGELGGGVSGVDRIEFLISPNPGEDLKPLVKVASGGEMSRIMLALRTVSTIDGHNKTLIFDEVDAGIGGQTADVLGQKLKRLSKRNQVLCVTHLPQVASYADQHFYIEKRVEKGRTLTHVSSLEGRAQVQEIARMISGDRITENVLRHAADLLKSCGGGRA
jgi:DNA repair protein RecN (Recombination protein N)